MMLIRSFESESEVVKERISVTPQKEYHDRKDARAGWEESPAVSLADLDDNFDKCLMPHPIKDNEIWILHHACHRWHR